MDYQHACVVDAEGFYKEFVLVKYQAVLRPPEAVPGSALELPVMLEPVLEWVVQDRALAEGERLIDTTFPTTRPYAGADGLIRPRWDDHTEAWVEGAAAVEIAAWEAEHPAPEPGPPTVEERVKLAEARIGAANDRQEFMEDCVAELAVQVYGV